MTDSLHTVRNRAIEIERLLDNLGAEGRGLGEKYRSLTLPQPLQDDLRQLNHLRNTVMHDGVDLTGADLERFVRLSDRVTAELQQMPAASARPSAGPGLSGSSQVPTSSQEDRTMGMLAWGLGFFFPILGPLILMVAHKSPYVQAVSKEVLNVHVSLIAYTLLTLGLLSPLTAIADIVFTVLGVMAANNGEIYRAPAVFRLIK
ncbi:DUF4870 domain-containing protein [Deinococcus lacus]|uniref:DUF4870 domain-containing protein n=1 Tax=Deinococcus lacus TaxID=392561 RepID=A0ABW1YFX6_9DEIO